MTRAHGAFWALHPKIFNSKKKKRIEEKNTNFLGSKIPFATTSMQVYNGILSILYAVRGP